MKRVFKKILIYLSVFFLFQIVSAYFIIHFVVVKEARESLSRMAERVVKELKYKNGEWDTTLYDADPETPHPNGSSGFPDPLYILTVDGFVIERNRPINGLLDTSDFKRLMFYDKPATIKEIVNESWRVYSLPIEYKNKNQGVIFVSYYGPRTDSFENINNILIENAHKIESQIKITGGEIDVSRVDVRNIHYEVSFEIVDRYNKVLLNNGRTPSLIDRSYVLSEIKNKRERIFRDKNTGSFLVISRPIKHNKDDVGLVVVAKSLDNINSLLSQFLLYSVVTNFIIIFPLTIGLFVFFERKNLEEKNWSPDEIKNINLDYKKGILTINGKHLVHLPINSNQFYLCAKLISKPNKKFSQDELLDMFGEELTHDSWRKVYDAMLAVNKKVGFKLIRYEDKVYFLNEKYSGILNQT